MAMEWASWISRPPNSSPPFLRVSWFPAQTLISVVKLSLFTAACRRRFRGRIELARLSNPQPAGGLPPSAIGSEPIIGRNHDHGGEVNHESDNAMKTKRIISIALACTFTLGLLPSAFAGN